MTQKALPTWQRGDTPLRTFALCRNFGGRLPIRDGRRVEAVRDLSLTVPKGAIYGFLGPNGAGKTTTIRILVGLLNPTGGTASVCGHSIREDVRGAQSHIGYMPDAVRHFPSMRAADFLVLFGGLSGVDKTTAKKRSRELLSWAGLDEPTLLETKINKWSAGMQRKLLLAQALLHEPDILILDEPTANLDPVARSAMIKLFKELASRKQTLFLSSHDLPEVQEVCTHIGFLTKGRLVLEDTKENLLNTVSAATGGTTLYTVSGSNLSAVTERVSERLGAEIVTATDEEVTLSTDRGLLEVARVLDDATKDSPITTVTNLTQKEESLEDVFLKIVELTKKETKRGD